MVFSDGILSGTNRSLSAYITEVQDQTNTKRGDASLGLYSWLDASIGEKFRLKHIEDVKKALEEPALLAFYGYGTISDILGRPWSAHPENINRHLKQWSFAILNDIRDVIDALAKNIFICDRSNNRIIKTAFGTSIGWTVLGGTQGSGQNQFYWPYSLAYDSTTQYIYIMDTYNNRVVRTKIDGSGWLTYGVPSAGQDQGGIGKFWYPEGIDFDPVSQTVWVIDTGNDRIVKFNASMDGSGWESSADYFGNPTAIKYDTTTDFCYIIDSGRHEISKLKIDGSGLTTYGSFGSGVGNFSNPDGIDYDPITGNIYVSDTGNSRVVRTTITGANWATTSGAFNQARHLYYDQPTDFIYVANRDENNIIKTKIDDSGRVEYGTFGTGTGQFNKPRDVSL